MTETYTTLKNYLEIIEESAKEARSQSDFKHLLYSKGFEPAIFRRVSDKRVLLRMTKEEQEDIAKRVKRIDHLCRMKNLKVPSFTGYEKFLLACMGIGLIGIIHNVVVLLKNKDLTKAEKARRIGDHVIDSGIIASAFHHW